MNSFTLFLITLIVVDLALISALVTWIRIRSKSSAHARVAAGYFITCFALYTIGQTMVILDVLEMGVNSGYANYLYAIAAVLFAIGSTYQYRSVT